MKRKTMLKRVMAVAMTGVVLLGTLAGCGKAAETGTTAGTAETEKTAEAGAAEGTAAAGDEGVPDTWIADRTIVIQAYVDDIGYSIPEDLNNTPVMQEITRLTGIKLEIQYTPGDSDSAVLASQLASGTIPDVVVTYLNDSTRPEFALLLKAAQEGMFVDLKPFMETSQVYKKYLEPEYLPNDSEKNITFREEFNGAAYILQLSIPAVDRSLEFNPQEEYVGGMYIQKSIAEALNINPADIRTQDQFYQLLTDIKAGGFVDDNGNPVYPLGPKYWGGSEDTLDYIVRGYDWGVSDGYNMDENGVIKHEAETEYVYEKINFVRKLLAEGLINPEFFTMDQTRAEEVSRTHNSAIVADVHNYIDMVYETGEWIPLGPLDDYTGDNAKVVIGKTGYGAWAVSEQAENPEEIFKFFDFLSTDQGQLLGNYGVEGVHYDMVDGKPVVKPEIIQKLNDGDTQFLVNEVGASFGSAGVVFFEYAMTDIDWLERYGESRPGSSQGGGFEGAIKIAEQYPYKEKLVPGLKATAYLSDPSMAEVNAQMSLLDYREMLVQAMYAESDKEVTSIVENFKKQLNAAGLEEFKALLKSTYDADKESIGFY